MTVTAPEDEYTGFPDEEGCTICKAPKPPDGRLYCSSACKQKAYRRRQTDRRLQRASERRKTDAEQHRNEWCRFLIDSANMSRKQAERTYTALMSIGRLEGTPYEQMSIGLP